MQLRRRARLTRLIHEKYGGRASRMAEASGIPQSDLSSVLSTKSFGQRRARAYEVKLGLPPMWLDSVEDGPAQFDRSVGELVDVRRQRLTDLIQKHFNGSQAEFSRITGMNQGLVSHTLGNGPFGQKLARNLELDILPHLNPLGLPL